MLPVSSWPPGPPGSALSPFGAPRPVNVGGRRHGYVLPKGAWIVRTGPNRVVMYTPDWQRELFEQPCRAMGTGYLPGQWQWQHGPRPPPLPPPGPTVFNIKAQAQWTRGKGGQPEMTVDIPAEAIAPLQGQFSSQKNSGNLPSGERNGNVGRDGLPSSLPGPVSRETRRFGSPFWRRPTHDQYLEAWRAWQRRIGRTDPPIRPIPGRVPPNWAGWRFVGAPSKVVVPSMASGLVVADGQNVVIQGGGFATITQAYSV